MSLRTHMASLGAALLDFVYPPHCPACEAWQPPGDREALCGACLEALTTPLGPRCRRCGAPRAPEAIDTATCASCRHWPPAHFSRALVAADFSGPVQGAVHALKFGGLRSVGELLGRCLATHPDLAEGLADLDVLIPVPLHPARRRERGFNQAEVIARGAGRALERPVRTDLLRRRRPTKQQARLEAHERVANVAGAFEALPKATVEPGWRRIGLVDDVVTTGTTLSACAEAVSRITPDVEVVAVAVASPMRPAR